MPLSTQLFNQISQASKRRSFGSGINNTRSLEITSQEVLSNVKPSLLDGPLTGPNDLNKYGLTSRFHNSSFLDDSVNGFNDYQRIPVRTRPKGPGAIEENIKKNDLSFNLNINPVNNYLTPSAFPSLSCEEDKKNNKKRKRTLRKEGSCSIGVNTENTIINEVEGISNKFSANLSNVLFFFLILTTFI
jgi:hypothetical protein